jgi:hypothetical protein
MSLLCCPKSSNYSFLHLLSLLQPVAHRYPDAKGMAVSTGIWIGMWGIIHHLGMETSMTPQCFLLPLFDKLLLLTALQEFYESENQIDHH